MRKRILSGLLPAMMRKEEVINLTWGDACPSNTYHDCYLNPVCKSCRFSWPTDDPNSWNSENAKCRC